MSDNKILNDNYEALLKSLRGEIINNSKIFAVLFKNIIKNPNAKKYLNLSEQVILNKEQKALYESLFMVEKMAIALIFLGKDTAKVIFNHLNFNLTNEILKYIKSAKSVDKGVLSAILMEFSAIINLNKQKNFNNPKDSKILKNLNDIPPKKLANLIINEQAQIIAIILSCLNPQNAANVLLNFSDELKGEVILKMANLGEISPRVSDNIFSTLKTMIKNDNELKFDDIIEFSADTIQKIVKNVDKKDLISALKGSSEQVVDKILNSLPEREIRALKERLNSVGALNLGEVIRAQEKIAKFICVLISE